MDEARARILARRARFLALALAACGTPPRPVCGTMEMGNGAAEAPSPAGDGGPIVDGSTDEPTQDAQEASAILRPAPLDASAHVAMACLSILVPTDPRFASGGARLEPSALPELDEVVRVLEQHPEIARLEVRGHVDTTEHEALGLARARAVRDYLTKKGIAPARLVVTNAGSSEPVAPNATDAGRAKNRRVEWRVLLPDGGVP